MPAETNAERLNQRLQGARYQIENPDTPTVDALATDRCSISRATRALDDVVRQYKSQAIVAPTTGPEELQPATPTGLAANHQVRSPGIRISPPARGFRPRAARGTPLSSARAGASRHS